MLSKLGHYAKAIVAAVAAVGTVLVTLAADPNVTSVLPQTVTQWMAGVGAVIVTFLAVFYQVNTPKA